MFVFCKDGKFGSCEKEADLPSDYDFLVEVRREDDAVQLVVLADENEEFTGLLFE